MIPLRDNQARRRLTPVNLILIAINAAVFVHEITIGSGIGAFINQYAMVPAHVTHIMERAAATVRSPQPWETLVTSMFLHGGLLHIAGNMLYLFIFGAAVEEAMGAIRYAAFYLAAGVAANLAMVVFMPSSTIPVLGASGAIAGVLGAYFILYPRARILTILPIAVLMYFAEIPAVIYLLLWFGGQLWLALSDPHQMSGGVAWWAHVGGFLFGMALGPMLAARGRQLRKR